MLTNFWDGYEGEPDFMIVPAHIVVLYYAGLRLIVSGPHSYIQPELYKPAPANLVTLISGGISHEMDRFH